MSCEIRTLFYYNIFASLKYYTYFCIECNNNKRNYKPLFWKNKRTQYLFFNTLRLLTK